MNADLVRSPEGVIEGALRTDLASIRGLLGLHALPVEDVDEASLDHFLVYRDGVGVAGAVGLERCEEVALLRSLVVADAYLRRGIGKRLVAAAEARGQERGLRAIYLLTTGAQAYFEALGFRAVARESAPSAIRRSSQFSALCPATAVLMVKQ
jgi:amino-acid N-acetyltransferase